MGEENSGAFKCVKISLIVLYVLSIILVVVFIALSIIVLAVINSYDPKDSSSQHKLTPEEKELAKNGAIGAIILFAISLVFTIIGLIGIIKENKCIVITITVFSVIRDVIHIAKGDIISFIIGLVVTVLTGIYAYMIIKNQKGSNAV